MRSRQTIAASLIIGLLAVKSEFSAQESGSQFESGSDSYLAEEAIDDPESADGSFQERVRVMQEWLRKREADRRHQNWGLDVVTPEPSDADSSRSSNYFSDHGYDERGFRRLDGNVRVRLRGLPHESKRQTHRSRRFSVRHSSRYRVGTTRKASRTRQPSRAFVAARSSKGPKVFNVSRASKTSGAKASSHRVRTSGGASSPARGKTRSKRR